MRTTKVILYSMKSDEIKKFLSSYYDENIDTDNKKNWDIEYENPIEMVDIIGAFIDNNDKFDINMWLCLDYGIFININETNSEKIIKYLFERYPY